MEKPAKYQKMTPLTPNFKKIGGDVSHNTINIS